MHSLEIKKYKEEEKKFKSREQQIKTALESAHLQASSLNLERVKLQKEIQNLQFKARNNNFNSSFALNLQSMMGSHLEFYTKILTTLDTFNHRIAFSMSKIKTAKILHTREIFSLRNKLGEEIIEQKRVKDEIFKFKTVESDNENLSLEIIRLKQELNLINEQFKNAENKAKMILTENNSKFSEFITELEAKLKEQTNDNDILLLNIEKITIDNKAIQDNSMILQNKLSAITSESQALSEKLSEISYKYDQMIHEINDKDNELKNNSALISNLKQDLESLSYEKNQEISDITEKYNLQDQKIQEYEDIINKLQQSNDNMLEEHKNEIEFLRNKLYKLEIQNKDLKKERDILFENYKKSTIKHSENKEAQTDNMVMKHTIIKKTNAPFQSRVKDIEAIGKEILDI